MPAVTPLREGNLVRLGRLLSISLRNLGAAPSPEALETLAVLVHEAMSGRGRSFHSVHHVFDLADGPNAYVALAAAFHDTVYLQVDGGLSERVESILAGSFERRGNEVRLVLADPNEDRLRAMVMALFEMPVGVPVAPTAGLNEMLSALLAVRALSGLLPEKALLRVAAAIEATVPFQGPAHAERLREKLGRLAQEFALNVGDDELDAGVRDGVELANKDVANFAAPDVARFLDNTWALLPETNWSLRLEAVYGARDYRTAMQRMEGFLSNLDARKVFLHFRGKPSSDAYEALRQAAAGNLAIAARYLGAKLVAACLLDALAQRTGGDAPMAMLMGDLPGEGEGTVRMERFLPAIHPPGVDLGEEGDADEVFRLLSEGRASPTGFDLRNSPLAGYLYTSMWPLDAAIVAARQYSAGAMDAGQYLDSLNPQVVAAVARACAQVAFFRKERLEALARETAAP
ncbi:MAG: hypothetical protein QM765_10465 [Myxococcales bacterium]